MKFAGKTYADEKPVIGGEEKGKTRVGEWVISEKEGAAGRDTVVMRKGSDGRKRRRRNCRKGDRLFVPLKKPLICGIKSRRAEVSDTDDSDLQNLAAAGKACTLPMQSGPICHLLPALSLRGEIEDLGQYPVRSAECWVPGTDEVEETRSC